MAAHVQIDAPHFCAGIEVRQGHVYEAAPILRWMIGKSWPFVESYCKKKQWKWKRVL